MRDAVENQIKHFGQTPSQVSVLNLLAFCTEILKRNIILIITLNLIVLFYKIVTNGTTSSKIIGYAFVSYDVLSCARWCLHDNEIPIKFTHLPYNCKYIPTTSAALCCDGNSKSTFCSEPMEHELLRWDKISQSSDLYIM